MNGLHPDLQAVYEEKLKHTRTFEQLVTNRQFTHFSQQPLDIQGAKVEEIFIEQLRVICIKPKQHVENVPCFIWFHGGGMVFGSPDDSISYLLDFVKSFQAVVLIPQYRLAPEYPYPAALEDGYQTLCWAFENAAKLHINRQQMIVSGGSAGGNLAIATALKARDENGPHITALLPLYPMLDWQSRPFHEAFTSEALWNHEKNRKAWQAYLQNCEDVPSYASPFYADVRQLPPIYTFIGTLDLFYEEVCEWVEKLKTSGGVVMLDCYEGCYHGFDLEGVPIAKEAKARLLSEVQKLLQTKH